MDRSAQMVYTGTICRSLILPLDNALEILSIVDSDVNAEKAMK